MSPARRPQLRLETLDERLVPAVVNLSTVGSSGSVNGAIFQQRSANADGADPTHTFLNVRESNLISSLLTPEEGYNTDGNLELDTANANVTRSLRVSELPIVKVGNVEYRELLLTTRQLSIAPNITLDELRIYVNTTSGSLRGYNQSNNKLANMTAVYDLDQQGNKKTDNSVKINDNLNRVDADVRVLIPRSAFFVKEKGQMVENQDAFVYVYSSFNAILTTALTEAESWSVREILPPASSAPGISGQVFLDENGNGKFDEGEVAQEGVTVSLFCYETGLFLETKTDANGNFVFNDPAMETGTYELAEQPLFGFSSGIASPGSEGGDGSEGSGVIANISYETGTTATNYLFGECFAE